MVTGSIDEFADLMTQTVTVFPPSTAARTLTGVRAAELNGTTFAAHIIATADRTVTREGMDVPVLTVAYLASTTPGDVSDKSVVQLTDGSTPPVARVDYVYDEVGAHHCKVQFGA